MINEILYRVDLNHEHTFLVLTKRPDRIQEQMDIDRIPKNLWIGVSVTKAEDLWRIEALRKLQHDTNLCYNHLFISFEPLMERISASR